MDSAGLKGSAVESRSHAGGTLAKAAAPLGSVWKAGGGVLEAGDASASGSAHAGTAERAEQACY